MEEEKRVIYAIIAACVIGIFIVGFLVVTYTTMKESFSELYFEEHEELPRIINVGEKEEFAFTVASHELNMTSYEYVVSLDDEILKDGGFTLGSDENITVNVSFIPENSSLMLVDEVEHNWTLRIPQKIEPITFLKSKNFTKIEKGLFFKGAIPLIDGEEISTFINLGELKEDIVLYNYTEFYRFGDINKLEPVNLTMGKDFSNLGYKRDIKRCEIKKDGENISLVYSNKNIEYRYKFKRISVEVTSEDGTEYEIHYWAIIVE
ncbi:MAG: DUF1616 domain-containing protein [Methanophagales archaeon]|nr:DUF1616 domain-containing protein [Methanophagales archaeon]RLG35189.1 MAG: hypothetical protein DRN97_00615 [Methanosarcinales archaeon]